MKNNFQKVMVTGLASIVCAGSMSIATLPNYSNLNSVDAVYAATIKDTAMTATGTVNSNVFLRKGPGTSYGKITILTKGSKVDIVAKSSNGWYKIKYKTYTINMNIGAIISAFGKFLFESFISCDIEVETIHPSNENAIGAIAAIQPVDFIAVISLNEILLVSPNINPAIDINTNGTSFIIVEAFWNKPPNFADKVFITNKNIIINKPINI